MNNYDMEANSRQELLTAFKQSYGRSMHLMCMLLEKFCPDMGESGHEGGRNQLCISKRLRTHLQLSDPAAERVRARDYKKETKAMANLPKIALDAWARGNDGTFGNSLDLNVIRMWEKEMK